MIGVSKHGQHTWIAKLKHNICSLDKLYGNICRVLTGTRKEEEIVVKRVKSETDENSSSDSEAVEVVHTVVSSSMFDRVSSFITLVFGIWGNYE